MKRTELLAPAGNYESFLGAIHAGADAVYLGGSRFGARAYADNLTEEEIIRAVRYAHLYGRRVYLTVNTLVKEKELSSVRAYLEPFYEAGLDAVIIQDMGVFVAVGEWFPGLERHISTQMAVTGVHGAAYLKSLGADRIVAARELSLAELQEIRKTVNIELEVFVHGAMCYSYSGQCLFSSLLGGRSGNRGRCAQPCRLPYRVETGVCGKESGCLLSLKDLCVISLLPELLKAGMDSLKIEGRMKSAAYAAGVTAVYRKYIDRYYEDPDGLFQVEPEDMRRLKALYIRSEIGEGYYRRHNGREMLTPCTPGYSKTDEKLAEEIKRIYVDGERKLPAVGRIRLGTGENAVYSVSCLETTVSVEGEYVQEAKSRPLSGGEVVRQLSKSGNSFFTFESIEADMDRDIFLPVKALNELRRAACEKLEKALIKARGFCGPQRRVKGEVPREADVQAGSRQKVCRSIKGGERHADIRSGLHVSVWTQEQLTAALSAQAERIYISADLIEACGAAGPAGSRSGSVHRQLSAAQSGGPEIYLALPYVLRKRDGRFLTRVRQLLCEDRISGVLARNLEELAWLKETGYGGETVTDMGLYLWNSASAGAFHRESAEQYLPAELNFHELKELTDQTQNRKLSLLVYGRLPMMVSAGCVAKTAGKCRAQSRNAGGREDGFVRLTDRRRTDFPVYIDCLHCYNVIYNSVPLSLHGQAQKVRELKPFAVRLDFTVESGNDTQAIIRYYQNWREATEPPELEPPFKHYTGGHFKRGVE